MNKFLLAAMALALTTGPVNAQLQWKAMEPVAQKSNLFPKSSIKLTEKVAMPTRSTRAGEEESVPFSAKTLSNMNGWDRTIYQVGLNGVGVGTVLKIATYFDPALLARFNGNTIKEFTTVIGPNMKGLKAFIINAMTGEVLWEGKKLPSYNDTSTNSKSVTFKCGEYVIDQATPIFIGYQVTTKSTDVKFAVANNVTSNGLLLDIVGDEYEGFQDLSAANGIVAYFDCVTEGKGGLKENDVKVLSVTGGRVLADGEYESTASFINYGSKPVASLNTTYTVNEETKDQSLNAEKPFPYMAPVQVAFKAKSPAEAARYLQNFTITKVNGVDDEYTEANALTGEEDNTTYNILTSISKTYPRTVVMEQFTGTWCGWCPRGHVAIDKATAAFPNEFIGIAVHGGDEMACEDYNPLLANIGNFPSAMLSRWGYSLVDPYYGFAGPAKKEGEVSGDILNDIKVINQSPVEAKVGLSTELKGSSINVSTILDFSLNAPGKGYSLAYVLMENGIRGYAQQNYYSKEAGKVSSESQIPEDDLKFLFKEHKAYMPTFNHVARLMKDPFGIEGSLDNVDLKAGELATLTQTLDIPATVKDKNNLEVAVLLFDKYTGEIVNAAKVKVGESTGVESVVAEAAEISVENGAIAVKGNGVASLYTVDGKLVSNVSVNGSASISTVGLKGVYVVRVVDGANVTVKKVLL